MCKLVDLNDYLEVFQLSILTFKAAGHTKFDVVFHENDSNYKPETVFL